jgi:aryl-alcohol dehydrogenase-like predicted oxidoreductase
VDRREAIGFLAAVGAAAALPCASLAQQGALTRAIPASGEKLPAVGLGTWITFDVTDAAERRARGEILRAFFDAGGRLVDSSPMYGASEETIGAAMPPNAAPLFAASKVWTVGGLAGWRTRERCGA